MPSTAVSRPLGEAPTEQSDVQNSLYYKVSWRLIRQIDYSGAFIERINTGYAKLQMKQALPFYDAVYAHDNRARRASCSMVFILRTTCQPV